MLSALNFPYPLPELKPEWRTSTVVQLAKAILENKDWPDMPILADALEEAGCIDQGVLEHLRGTWRTCSCCDGKKRVPYAAKYENDGSTTVMSWRDCYMCDGRGQVPEDTHGPCAAPYRNGCWHGTCWLVRHLAGVSQILVARFKERTGSGEEVDQEATAINPGDWFGKTWQVVAADCMDPPRYIVEADTPSDAEEEWIDSDYGAHYRIEPNDPDYLDPDRVHFTGAGTAYDGENIMIYGQEFVAHVRGSMPFACRYFGPGLPHEGVSPLVYQYGEQECEHCEKKCFAYEPLALRLRGHYCSQACHDLAHADPQDDEHGLEQFEAR